MYRILAGINKYGRHGTGPLNIFM